MIILIAAMADNNVIGKDGELPWHLPDDLEHFKEETTGNTVVMGRKTYDSIGAPLPQRDNIVVTNQDITIDGATVAHSIDEALDTARDKQGVTYVIGGESIYEQTLDEADKLLITHVKQHVDGDTYFPTIDPLAWQATQREDTDDYTIMEYTRT
jgi:dihydrofolate reductase